MLAALRDDGTDEGVAVAEIVANAIGLLIQTDDACAALIGTTIARLGTGPVPGAALDSLRAFVDDTARREAPVAATRRYRGDAEILVDLAGLPPDDGAYAPTFGRGVHACPGAALALTIVSSILACLLEAGFAPRRLRRIGSVVSPTLRMPIFTTVTEEEAS